MNIYQNYDDQIKEMAMAARIWWKMHPSANPEVKFNFPKGAFVIGTVSRALTDGFVQADDDGKRFIKDICYAPGKPEPTVMMLKIALELAKEGLNG